MFIGLYYKDLISLFTMYNAQSLSSCASPVHFIGPVVSLRFTLIYFGLTFQMRVDNFMLIKVDSFIDIFNKFIVYGSLIKLLKIENDYN